MEGALSTAYAWLSPDAARLFERLGLVTGEFCLHAAALAAGTTAIASVCCSTSSPVRTSSTRGAGVFRYDAVVGRFARRLAAAQELTLAGWQFDAGCADCHSSPPADLARLEAAPV